MNPPDRAPEDFVNVVNRATGEVYFCLKSPDSSILEVMETSSTSLKVVNLQAKFSKICDRTFKVILYAKDMMTKQLGRYIFENNDIRLAPDCHCDGCKLTANEYGDNTSVFTNAHGFPLILLSIAWTGCHYKGKCDVFVDPSSGVIGTYRRTGMGLVVEQQNQMIQLFPCKDLSEPLNHHLIMVAHCPHLDQNIYICERARERVYLTFNRRHMRFETVHCGCTFDSVQQAMYHGEKMVDHFPSLRQGTYIGIFCSIEGKLEWRSFKAETNAWMKNDSGGQRVVNFTHLSCHDLMLRYNFYRNDQEPFLDTLDDPSTRDPLFIEPTPVGNIYWMVNKNHEILPYKYARTPFSIYGRTKRFSKQCEVSVYKDRQGYKDVLEGNPIPRRKHDDLVAEINNHTCVLCIRNPKIYVEPRKRRHDRESLDELLMDDLEIFGARSQHKSTAPPPLPKPQPQAPPPAVDPFYIDPLLFPYTQMRQQELSKGGLGYLPPHMVNKIRAPVGPPPPASYHIFPEGQHHSVARCPPGYVPMHTSHTANEQYQLTTFSGYTQNPNAPTYYAKYAKRTAEQPREFAMLDYPDPSAPRDSNQSADRKMLEFLCLDPPPLNAPASSKPEAQADSFQRKIDPLYYPTDPLANHPNQKSEQEYMMKISDLFQPEHPISNEEMIKLMDGTRDVLDTDILKDLPKETPKESFLPRFRLLPGSTPARGEPLRRELVRTVKRMRDEEKEQETKPTSYDHFKEVEREHWARLMRHWGAQELARNATKAAQVAAAAEAQAPIPPPPPPPVAAGAAAEAEESSSSSSGESIDDEEEYTDEEEEGRTPPNMDTILESLANRIDDLDVHHLD
ncbi:unnamed protein product [Caenorhabditis brenneri]